jgi:hypothetical protein
MSRRLLLAVMVAGLVPLLAGDEPAATGPPQRVKRFQRDRQLIETLVQGGLHLAGTEDPLQRADYCNKVAARLAAEVEQAAQDQEKARLAELTQYLHALLEEGVAANLDTARSRIPTGSAAEKRLQAIRDRAAGLILPLQEQLEFLPDPEDQEAIRHTLKALREGQRETERNGNQP